MRRQSELLGFVPSLIVKCEQADKYKVICLMFFKGIPMQALTNAARLVTVPPRLSGTARRGICSVQQPGMKLKQK